MKSIKSLFFWFLMYTGSGREIIFFIKKIFHLLPPVNFNFPISVSIEISSICNLSCIHCPSHLESSLKIKSKHHGLMETSMFDGIMNEIDDYGITDITLHKDGEPLLHPQILYILERVKKNRPHKVKLITNGHYMTPAVTEAVFKNKIDQVLFSIGAFNKSFYEKIKGKDFEKVIDNIMCFLGKREYCNAQTDVTVQIINLPEFPEMEEEIKKFKSFWEKFDVKVMISEKLNWGIFDSKYYHVQRYPCPQLWRNLFIHWDGEMSACCIDWDQSMSLGNYNNISILKVWLGDNIRRQRNAQIQMDFRELNLCRNCNYWFFADQLDKRTIFSRQVAQQDMPLG